MTIEHTGKNIYKDVLTVFVDFVAIDKIKHLNHMKNINNFMCKSKQNCYCMSCTFGELYYSMLLLKDIKWMTLAIFDVYFASITVAF